MKLAKKIALAALAAVALLGLSTCSSKGAAIKSATDLDGKRVGVRGGTTGETWAKANLKRARVASYRAYTDAVVDLKRGAIDAIIAGEMRAQEIVAENNDLQILRDVPSFFSEEYGIAVKKGNAELLGSVNAAIQRARESGEYDLLYSSFIEPAGGSITIPSLDIPIGVGTLRLGTNAAFSPFGYIEGSEIVGFDISLGQLIARECGANLTVVDMAFPALIPALDAGEIDLIAAAMTITEARKETVDFSVSYFTTEQVIIVKK